MNLLPCWCCLLQDGDVDSRKKKWKKNLAEKDSRLFCSAAWHAANSDTDTDIERRIEQQQQQQRQYLIMSSCVHFLYLKRASADFDDIQTDFERRRRIEEKGDLLRLAVNTRYLRSALSVTVYIVLSHTLTHTRTYSRTHSLTQHSAAWAFYS